MRVDGMTVVRGFADTPEISAVLASIGELEASRLAIYSKAGEDGFAFREQLRLRRIEGELEEKWVEVRRLRHELQYPRYAQPEPKKSEELKRAEARVRAFRRWLGAEAAE